MNKLTFTSLTVVSAASLITAVCAIVATTLTAILFASVDERIESALSQTTTANPDTPTDPDSPPTEPPAEPAPDDPLAGISQLGQDMYERFESVVAYLYTPTGYGSGVLVEHNNKMYVVSAWHVTFPQQTITRVIFSNGETHDNIPIIVTDSYRDITIVGPIETDIEPAELGHNHELALGTETFLIGYPGATYESPRLSITEGVITDFLEWKTPGLTFIETDAPISGGQSGGIGVSGTGVIMGISNYSGIDPDTALITDINDLLPSITGLLNGEDINGGGDRSLLDQPSAPSVQFLGARLESRYDNVAFVIPNVKEGEIVHLKVTTPDDNLGQMNLEVFNIIGDNLYSSFYDEPGTANEFDVKVEADWSAPLFVTVDAFGFVKPIVFNFESSHPAHLVEDDLDDGRELKNGLFANLDYYSDIDWFKVDMEAGETLTVCADSFIPDINIEYVGVAVQGYDEESGGGFYDLNPRVTFTAEFSGEFLAAFFGYNDTTTGGYTVMTGEHCDDL